MNLSILIPTIKRHESFVIKLRKELYSQMIPYSDRVEIICDNNENDSTGKKRNRLLQIADGDYVSFFDSDDWPSKNYVQLLMGAVETGCDCASLKGVYSVDGVEDGIFEHSIKYSEWKTTSNEIKYERFPTPLNLIRSEIAKKFKFPDISFGEDHHWSKQIHDSGLLKTEHYIPEVIYYYNYISKK